MDPKEAERLGGLLGPKPVPALGRYEIGEALGSGATGTVYRAWDKQLQRDVAVKVLQHDSRRMLDRFVREAAVIAKLSHPNIVSVYDFGESEGRFYIVLQLIEGAPIHDCRLSPREAAAAVRDAARALDHAHRLGVLHRDIKPANLMRDGSGRVYVMDFGLAREVEADSSITQSNTVLGTPAYMSPEQACGWVRQVDERSDIYSLGATLYELLAGRLPFEANSVPEVLMKVVNYDADPPRKHRPSLDRDLEMIVLKAMEKERDRRYATAAELADDLDRYLAGEPVRARPASLTYRLLKRMRRNPALWTIVAVGAMVLIAIGTVLYVQIGARQKAEEKSRKAESLEQDLLPLVDAARSRLQAADKMMYSPSFSWTRWNAVLVEAERFCEEALSKDPRFALARLELGRIHMARGEWTRAIEQFDQTLQLNPALGAARLERARARVELVLVVEHEVESGSLHEGVRQKERVLLGPARTDLEEAARSRLERDEAIVLDLLFRLIDESFDDVIERARKLAASGELDERAYRIEGEALHRARKLGAHEPFKSLVERRPGDARAWARYAHMLHDNWKYEEAITACNRALALYPDFAEAYKTRGLARRKLGQIPEAIADYDEARRLQPEDAQIWHFRAGAVRYHRRYDEAIQNLEEALRLNPEYLDALLTLSTIHLENRDPERSLATINRALEIKNDYAEGYCNRGEIYRARGELSKALNDFDRAIQLRPRDYYEAYSNRGLLHYQEGRFDDALRDLNESIRIFDGYPEAFVRRGVVNRKLGRPKEALADYNRALELNPANPNCRYNRGVLYETLGELEAALADYLQVTVEAPDLDAWTACARIEMALRRWKDAEKHIKEALLLKPGDPTLKQWLEACRRNSN